MKDKPKPVTMLKVWDQLTRDDKAVICFVLNGVSESHKHIHPGTLAFVPVADIATYLETGLEQMGGKFKRRISQILSVIASALPYQNDEVAVHTMRLNSKKVLKWFGQHPERGVPVNWLPKERVTVGMRWLLPRKCYEYDDNVLVAPCVRLCPSTKDIWCITITAKYWPRMSMWLVDNCQ